MTRYKPSSAFQRALTHRGSRLLDTPYSSVNNLGLRNCSTAGVDFERVGADTGRIARRLSKYPPDRRPVSHPIRAVCPIAEYGLVPDPQQVDDRGHQVLRLHAI